MMETCNRCGRHKAIAADYAHDCCTELALHGNALAEFVDANETLRARVAALEAETAAQAELIEEFQSAIGINVGGAPSGVTPQHVEREVVALRAGLFTPDALRRIADRVSRKPRNGQDIRIEAQCRRALATDTPAPAREVAARIGAGEHDTEIPEPRNIGVIPYTGFAEHPSSYAGPCDCDTCRSYGAEDGQTEE